MKRRTVPILYKTNECIMCREFRTFRSARIQSLQLFYPLGLLCFSTLCIITGSTLFLLPNNILLTTALITFWMTGVRSLDHLMHTIHKLNDKQHQGKQSTYHSSFSRIQNDVIEVRFDMIVSLSKPLFCINNTRLHLVPFLLVNVEWL